MVNIKKVFISYSSSVACEYSRLSSLPVPEGRSDERRLYSQASSSDVVRVTGNLISVLEINKIRYQLGGPIDPNMADKMYESLQVLLVVLSHHYPTDRGGGGGGGKRPEKARQGRFVADYCFYGQSKERASVRSRLFRNAKFARVWRANEERFGEKKLLYAISGDKVISLWKSTSQTDFQTSNCYLGGLTLALELVLIFFASGWELSVY